MLGRRPTAVSGKDIDAGFVEGALIRSSWRCHEEFEGQVAGKEDLISVQGLRLLRLWMEVAHLDV